jgi:hypothetical protein
MSTPIEVEVSVGKFLTAGLDPEGIYRLRIKKMSVEERTVQNGERVGTKYTTISSELFLVERFGEGLLENPPRVFTNFGTSGKGLERFRKLYMAAFGELSSNDRDEKLTLNDLAASLVGNDSVWTTYFWKRNQSDTAIIEGSIGWTFSSDPTKIKEPTPFEERDARSAA